MKYKIPFALFTISSFIINFQMIAQAPRPDSLKKELIGTWEFVELRNEAGLKIDTIYTIFGIELIGSPILTYNKNGTYSKEFMPGYVDSGKWHYDGDKHLIIQLLYYKKPYNNTSKYLIDKGHAKKDKNGDYYEVITDKIIELGENILILSERENWQRTFRKVKE